MHIIDPLFTWGRILFVLYGFSHGVQMEQVFTLKGVCENMFMFEYRPVTVTPPLAKTESVQPFK